MDIVNPGEAFLRFLMAMENSSNDVGRFYVSREEVQRIRGIVSACGLRVRRELSELTFQDTDA